MKRTLSGLALALAALSPFLASAAGARARPERVRFILKPP